MLHPPKLCSCNASWGWASDGRNMSRLWGLVKWKWLWSWCVVLNCTTTHGQENITFGIPYVTKRSAALVSRECVTWRLGYCHASEGGRTWSLSKEFPWRMKGRGAFPPRYINMIGFIAQTRGYGCRPTCFCACACVRVRAQLKIRYHTVFSHN
jgi:hypothetical protein